MTNATLRGMPDAGNPHVRFDEGEVASAKPRRGSLLNKIEVMLSLAAFCSGIMAAQPYDHRVEYLESDGYQYINSGICPNEKTMVVASYQYLSVVKNHVVRDPNCDMIAGVNAGGRYYPVSLNYSKASRDCERHLFINTTITKNHSSNRRHDVLFNDLNRQVFVDGSYAGVLSGTLTCKQPMYIFAGSDSSGNAAWFSNARIWSLDIYTNGIPARMFRPVVDNDGVACFYDQVTRSCFYNRGTGSFATGAAHDDYAYEVESLTANAAPWIDSRVQASTNVSVHGSYRFNSQIDYSMICGVQNSGANYYPASQTTTWLEERHALLPDTFYVSYATAGRRVFDFNDVQHAVYANGAYQNTLKCTKSPTSGFNIYLFACNTAKKTSAYHSKSTVWNCRMDDSGTRVRDFEPVVDVNGSPCMVDRITGKLYPNKSATPFTPGRIVSTEVRLDLSARTDLAVGTKVLSWTETPSATTVFVLDETTAATYEVARRSDGAYLVAADSQLVTTATWTGAAGDGNHSNPANWECRNSLGSVLAEALPGECTRILLASQTTFCCPEGTSLPGASLQLTGTVTLGADCDWRGLGTLVIPDGVTIDLRGHKLQLDYFNGLTSGLAIITDSSGTGGELHFSVPGNNCYANEKVILAGSLNLVKEGTGIFYASRRLQVYTGSTKVAEGYLRIAQIGHEGWKNVNYTPIGLNPTVVVESGAVFDPCGYYSAQLTYVLNGGTVRQSKEPLDWEMRYSNIEALALNGDSSVLGKSVSFVGAANGRINCKLSGHCLTVNLDADSNVFGFQNSAFIGAGTVRVQKGKFTTSVAPCGGSLLNLEFPGPGGAIDLGGVVLVSNLTFNATAVTGTGTVKVYGSFAPTTKFPNVEMQNGATLDLSTATGTVNTTSGTYTLGFATGVTVFVDVGTRKPARNEPLLTWTQKPSNVKFELSDGNGQLVVRDDGLYYELGLVIVVR